MTSNRLEILSRLGAYKPGRAEFVADTQQPVKKKLSAADADISVSSEKLPAEDFDYLRPSYLPEIESGIPMSQWMPGSPMTHRIEHLQRMEVGQSIKIPDNLVKTWQATVREMRNRNALEKRVYRIIRVDELWRRIFRVS